MLHQDARKATQESKERNKSNYDRTQNPREFKKNDRVLFYDESVRRGRSRKLDSQWRGPFTVVDVQGPNVIIRLKGKKCIKVHTNRLKEFY